MNEPYSILMQKTTENAPVKDSLVHFGIVCTEFPFKPGGETKDVGCESIEEKSFTKDPDEDGEDTYIPDKLPLKAYDLEAEMCYKGDLGTAYDKIMAFQNYLTGENGDGATLKIYNLHTGIGRQGLYLLEVGDFEFNKSNMDEVLTFPVKFRVTDPRIQIIPSYSVAEPTKIVALVEKV